MAAVNPNCFENLMSAAERRESVCGGTTVMRISRFIGRIETDLQQCQHTATTSVVVNIGAHNLDILDAVVAQCRNAGYVATLENYFGLTPNCRGAPTKLCVSFDTPPAITDVGIAALARVHTLKSQRHDCDFCHCV